MEIWDVAFWSSLLILSKATYYFKLKQKFLKKTESLQRMVKVDYNSRSASIIKEKGRMAV